MASPLVCGLQGKEGCDGVRLAIDYRYVNRFTRDDAYVLPDVPGIQYFPTCWEKSFDNTSGL